MKVILKEANRERAGIQSGFYMVLHNNKGYTWNGKKIFNCPDIGYDLHLEAGNSGLEFLIDLFPASKEATSFLFVYIL